MSSSYFKTDGTPLVDVLPLESNGPGNVSTPRQIIDVELLDNNFTTPTDAFVVNDDVSARFLNGFTFDVVGGPHAGSYVVNLTGFLPNDVVVQVVDGKSHIPVADIVSTSMPYDFFAGFTSPSLSPFGTPGNYHVTWQLDGDVTGSIAVNDTVIFKNILYNTARQHLSGVVLSMTYTGTYTNVITALYDDAFMPVIGVDVQSRMLSPAPTVTPHGFVQYTVPSVATSLRLVGQGAPRYNDTVSWGNAMQSNMVQMLEHFADDIAPVSPLDGQLWFDTNLTGPALQLRYNSDWYGVVAEGLPVQGNINMNDFKIANVANAATTFPYVVSTTGWGNNDQEVINLGTADSLYIAKTGGYDTNLTNRSGTMSGELSVTPHIYARELLTTSTHTTGQLRLGAIAQTGMSFKSNDSSFVYVDFVDATGDLSNLVYNFGTNLLEFGSTVAGVAGTPAVTIDYDTGSTVTKQTTFTNNQEYITKLFGDTTYVNVAGDTMTGNLILNADPTAALGAATKQYVDMFVSGIIWLTPILDSSVFDDSLSAPPVDDGYTSYHKSFIVAGVGTGAWAGFDGHLMQFNGTTWESVLGRPVAVNDRLGVFMEPHATDPLSTLPGGGLTGFAGRIVTVTGVGPYTYTPYTPAEPDAVTVVGVNSVSAAQSFYMGNSYTFRGTYGSGAYTNDYAWIQFLGPQSIIDGDGLKFSGQTLNVDGNVLSLYNLATQGIIVHSATDTVVSRTLTGTAGNVDVSNGDGVSGNPTINLASVTQGTTGVSFIKVGLDGFGRVINNDVVTSADITTTLGYTPVDASGDSVTGDLVLENNSTTTSQVQFVTMGDGNTTSRIVYNQTSNATVTELFVDGTGGTSRLVLPDNTTWFFEIHVVARRTDVDNESAAYKFEGAIDRNTGAASVALVGTVATTVVAEDTAGWDVVVDADATNGSLRVQVTGEAAKTIRWVANAKITGVTG